MGRSKIKAELIEDDKKRKTSYEKRKSSLIKKISELSILCDIKACMIIYEGNNDQMWPNDPNEVEKLLNLYKNQSLQGPSKRDKTLENDDQKKKKKVELEKKYPTWDSRFDYLSAKELQNLVGVVEKKIENAKGKIEFLKSTKIQDSNIETCSVSDHQEIWDFPELMNDDLTNQISVWPISYVNNPCTDYNNLFQADIPISGTGVNSMDNGLLTIEDFEYCNADYEKWLANDGIGSSSTMQQYPHDDMPCGFL